jgi:hypothetical protein
VPVRLLRLHPCWLCRRRRRAPGCSHDKPCRTGDRSESWVRPSLSHVTPSVASEHYSELLGFPISCPSLLFSVCLELRPLSSTGITRLQRSYGPLRHPTTPGLAVTGCRLVITPDHLMGLPVLPQSSFCTCRRYYPGGTTRFASLSSPVMTAFPSLGQGRLPHCSFRGLPSRTYVTARTVAEWLNHPFPLHQSLSAAWLPATAAPVVTSRSESCRRGLPPPERPCLCTAHPSR